MKIQALCFGKFNKSLELFFWLLGKNNKKCGEMLIEIDQILFDQFQVGKIYGFIQPPQRHEMAVLKGEFNEEHH